MKDLRLMPRVSEKAYALSQNEGTKTYVFEVPAEANKHSVARGITAQYSVVVTNVRILNVKGKAKRLYRKGGRTIATSRSDVKKAYVTLRQGDSLPLFVEEAAQEEKQTKAAEKAAKKTAKEKK